MKTTLPPSVTATVVPDAPHSDIVWLTTEQCQRFLSEVARGASMVAASNVIDVPYMAIARQIGIDPQFAADLEAAKQIRNMAIEEIGIEQATVGVDEVLTYQGQVMCDDFGEPVTVKKLITGNSLLLAILKANNPEKFGDRSTLTISEKDAPGKITTQSDREQLLAILKRRGQIAAPQTDDNDGSDLV